MGGGAVAVILLRERQVVDAFERAGAIAPDGARRPEELGVDPHGLAWRRLRERAVVREAVASNGRYYLDREVWRAVRRTRRRLGIVLLAIVVIAGMLFGVFGR